MFYIVVYCVILYQTMSDYVYIYMNMFYNCVSMDTYTYMYISRYIRKDVCIYTCIYPYILYIHTYHVAFACWAAYTHLCIHACMHLYIYMHA